MWVASFLIGSLIVLVMLWIRQRRQKLRLLADIGIPGPEPHLVFGNMKDMRQKGQWEQLKVWAEKYGNTFGYYDGAVPFIVTSDVELLRHVFVKDFPQFHARKAFSPEDAKHGDMFTSSGNRWRRLRSISSPTFTTAKMRLMSPLVNTVVDNIMKLLHQKAESKEPFNIHEIYQRLTMDVIASTAFGIEVNSVENPDNEFLHRCRYVFNIASRLSRSTFFKFMFLIRMIDDRAFWLIRSLLGGRLIDHAWFHKVAEKIITERKSTGTRRPDFIQLMLDAHESDVPINDQDLAAKVEEDEAEPAKNGTDKVPDSKSPPERKGKQGMTSEEIQGNAMMFMLAGYETTSTALGYLSYDLATNPDIQQKLQQEIDEHFPDVEFHPDNTSVQRLPYLDMVFSECLRLHPIAIIATARKTKRACTIRGQHFPVDTAIQADMLSIHMDPEHWGPEDPKLFVPERFLPERKATRHPMAWMPFGAGPRNCVGMRFALMEVKIAIVRILKQFTIQKCVDTQIPIQDTKMAVRSPQDGVTIVLAKREL